MKNINITNSLKIFLAVSVFFLYCFVSVSQAQMPSYEILTPITANLNKPQKIALGPDEYIHVTESGNNKLLVYNPIGGYIRALCRRWQYPLIPI